MEFIKQKKELLLALAAIIFISIPTLLAQFEYASDINLLHEEQSQLFLDHKIKDSALFPDGYVSKYQESSKKPILYDIIYKSLLKYFDVYSFHKMFPMAIWVAMIFFMGLAAYKMGGIYAMWGAVVITIPHSVFLYQITSSIPHSFAYLLVIMSIVCILYAKIYFLALVGILSALLYPAVSPIIGLSMAYFLLIMNKENRGSAKEWSIYKRLIILAVTGGIMLSAIYPVMSHKEGYGRSVAFDTETKEFPENSKESKVFLGTVHPIVYVIIKLYFQFDQSNGFVGFIGMLALLALLIISIRGWYFFKDNILIKSRFNVFVVSSIVSFILIYFFMPLYTYRVLLYTLPIFYILLFPITLLNLVKQDKKLDIEFHKFISISIIIVMALLLGGRDSGKIGYMLDVSEKEQAFFDFFLDKPEDTLITAWPAVDRYNDWIPYLSKREVLVMKKLHQTQYSDYIIEIRKRLFAIVDAFLTDDIEKIRYLNKEFGVDYLVLDINMYDDEMPNYAPPFLKRIEELWLKNKKDNNFEILKHLDKAVYHKDNLYVIDLNKL